MKNEYFYSHLQENKDNPMRYKTNLQMVFEHEEKDERILLNIDSDFISDILIIKER